MKITTIAASVGIAATIAGSLYVVPALYYKQKASTVTETHIEIPIPAQLQTITPSTLTGKPVRIIVSDVHIDLPVIDGERNPKTGDWTLTNNKAQFATITSQPNNMSGNTFIYGHETPAVFIRLQKLALGKQAVIETDNGLRFYYTYESTYITDPTDVSVLTYTGEPRLTLQTCTGAWSQKRQMFVFTFDKVEKF